MSKILIIVILQKKTKIVTSVVFNIFIKEMEQISKLSQKFSVYKKAYQTLSATRELFKKLLVEFKVCIKCIFRLYSFQQPKIYNDSEFYIEILPYLLDVEGNSQLLNNYDPIQCCMSRVCWLCQQIFQKSFINKTVKQILQKIDEKSFNSYTQFKLNVRVPNIIILRNIILARYVYYQLLHKGATENDKQKQSELALHFYNILIYPFEANKFVDPKTVLKWILANEINSNSLMTSSADDHPQNLVISIEQQHTFNEAQSVVMNNFRTYLGLQKKKEKAKGRKKCLDLGQNQILLKDYKCNANNINKILNLKQNQFEQLLSKIHSIKDFWRLVNGTDQQINSQTSGVSQKISLITKHVFLCGKYIKFSRYLSQTPWMVNGKKLTEGSLQEEIENLIFSLFYPGKQKDEIQTKFHSGGREDIDVRMLKGGRPFVLQFVNPIRTVNHISQEQVLKLVSEQVRPKVESKFKEWVCEQKDANKQQFHSWRTVKLMQLLINQQSKDVKVQELQETTQSFISVELKAAEMQKIKHYLCYIHSPTAFTQEDCKKLHLLQDICLQQLTPLRVLHRRTLMIRDKIIHRVKMHLVSKHSAILQVWASAGTYIKEFVHGDLGRTTPNVGSLLEKEVDILQLDVGSLKQGEWQKGDEEIMKMQHFQWMN